MLVEQIMNSAPYTLTKEHTIRDAMKLMREKKFVIFLLLQRSVKLLG